MKSVDLIAAGEIKFPGLKILEKEYLQKIGYYVKCNLKIVKEPRYEDERMVRERVSLSMSRLLQPTDLVVALDREGKKMDSLHFASWLSKSLSYHAHRIVFLIGGFCGLSPALDSHIRLKLSFSDLTFPHDLFRILFMEQLYRALTIIHGVTYHR